MIFAHWQLAGACRGIQAGLPFPHTPVAELLRFSLAFLVSGSRVFCCSYRFVSFPFPCNGSSSSLEDGAVEF